MTKNIIIQKNLSSYADVKEALKTRFGFPIQ